MPRRRRVYVNVTVEIDGEQGSVTREVESTWPNHKPDARAILAEAVAVMDEAIIAKETAS